MEKKTCPIAASIVFAVIFEKSGIKKNFTPSQALSSVKTRIISTISNRNSSGIISLQNFSIPFSMPM